VLTLHRPSNVEDAKTLKGILSAVSTVAREFPIFFPAHPRTRKNIANFGLEKYLSEPDRGAAAGSGIVPLEPLGYLDFLALNDRARVVLTDSGGVQEETTVLGVPCLTLRENTERPVTVDQGSNQVVGTSPERIAAAAEAVLQQPTRKYSRPPLWDGKAASRIVSILRELLL
jgi:UDP-N-acetylglucosamine 2-epimerase (non-hydrolysing)